MVSRSRSAQGRARRGFAAMDPEERREISRRGGTASHASGRGHEFNSQEAREAGRRGGEARWGRGRPEEEERDRPEGMLRRGASSSSRSRGRSRND
jgi:general stress protein YciG